MSSRLPIALAIALTLSGCSYVYDLKAVVIDGRLAFIVDPDSRKNPSCFSSIGVIASGGERTAPSSGDDTTRIGYGTFWYEWRGHDCVDTFPVLYGQQLKGKPDPLGQAPDAVAAKPLRIGVIYEVTISGDGGGYGGGAFKILPNRRLINVPRPPMTGIGPVSEPVAGNVSS